MVERRRAVPGWFPYLDLACVAVATGLWYALPQAGPWPLLLALAPWPMRLALTGRLSRHTPFDLPLAFFLATALLAVWTAYDRTEAWSKFWLILAGVLLFFALANAEPLVGKRAWLLALLGAAIAVYFLATNDWTAYPAKVEILTSWGRALQGRLPALVGRPIHPNVVGGMLVALVPFAGWAAIEAWQGIGQGPRSRRLARWFLLVGGLGLVAVVSFGLLMTTSRGAWLGLGGALLLAGLWVLSGWLSPTGPQRRVWILPGLLVLALAIALGIGFAWPGGPLALLDALPGPSTGLGRVELLRNTLPLVRDYPLLGAGLGGFQMLYSTYAILIHVGYISHSHNMLLNVAVEQGLVAVLALLWMWFLFARAVWSRGLGLAPHVSLGLLGAATVSLLAMAIHGLADNVLYSSHGVFLMFVPLAFAASPPEARPERASRRWALALPLVVVLLLGAALVWRGPALSLLYSNLGAVHQSQAELSVYTWPQWPLQDAVRQTVDLSRPVAEFERALALDPRNATANRRLGMIDLSLGEYPGALRHLEAAYASDPGNVATRQLLGEALIANGQLDQGRALWATVPNGQGQLAVRVFWYQHIGDAERAAWMQAAASRQ